MSSNFVRFFLYLIRIGYTCKRRLFCDFHKLLQRQAACARMNVAPLDGPRASREIQLWRRILLDLVLEKALWKKICVQSPTRLCCTMNYTIVFSGILFLLFATSLASEAEDAAKAKAKGSKRKLFFQVTMRLYKFDFFFDRMWPCLNTNRVKTISE